MNDAPKRGVLRLVVPGLALLVMATLLLYASGGSSISCRHDPDGTRCVVARRILRVVDVPVRRASNVQGVKMQVLHVSDDDGDDVPYDHPYLVTPAGLVSLLPPGVHWADAETVGQVEAFCKDKSAAPLVLRHDRGRLWLGLLGALMAFWGASLVLEALRAVFDVRVQSGARNSYAVTRDGRRFLVATVPEGHQDDPIQVLVNALPPR